MPFTATAQADPIPGYRLVECLGRGGAGEVWTCIDPSGRRKAVKIILDGREELPIWQALETIRHPCLIAVGPVALVGDSVVVVLEPGDKSLREYFDECRNAGQAGIPREELLGYLLDVANALDYLQERSLCHLLLKPANLLLVGGAKVADYGLASHERMPTGYTAIYAPPELLTGRVHPHSDQYSLAIIYQELLTGQRPFLDSTAWQSTRESSNLIPLPEHDRPIVARALARNPDRRWPSCRDFVQALSSMAPVSANPVPLPSPREAEPPADLPSSTIKCPYCHCENEDGALFCERCTTDLNDVAPTGSTNAPAAPPPVMAEPMMAEPMPFDDIPTILIEDEDRGMPAYPHDVCPIPLEPVSPIAPPPSIPSPMPVVPPLPPAPAPAPAPVASVPTGVTLPCCGQPGLLVLRGQKRNVEYPIYEGLNFIGRADEIPVDIDLEEQEPPDRIWCSRQHACISFEDGQLQIEDLNSANGTYVNRSRIYPGQKRPLTINDIVQIGNVQLKVLSGFVASSPAPVSPETPENKRPPAPEKERRLLRHTDISFPARVPVAKVCNLRVQLVPAQITLPSGEVREVPRPHVHDVTVGLEIPRPVQPSQPPPPLRVSVSVAAENFDMDGPTRADIIVPLAGKSPPVSFRLRGLEVGPGRIMIDFEQEGQPVGSVDLQPEVIDPSQGESSQPCAMTGEIGLSTCPAGAPDVVLKVFEYRLAGQPGRLHFVLSSTHPGLRDLPVLDGDLGTQDLLCEPAKWVGEQLLLVSAVANRPDASAEEVQQTLGDIGNRLYDQLLPQPVQELFWKLVARQVRSVLILSDEPHIPWELIKPYRLDPLTGAFAEEGNFWGEAFALTHWLRGRPPVHQLSVQRIVALATGEGPTPVAASRDIVPEANAAALSSPPLTACALPAALEELAMLRNLEKSGARVQVLPARRRDLQDTLRQGGFDLLHLACHGLFGGQTADASGVLMEDGLFSAAELSPRLTEAMQRAAPLIFFNACHSGRLGFSLTRLGSWGAQLVRLGCGGFIGALWPVTDTAALAFARAFYDCLLAGQPIGEAVRGARQRIRAEFPRDPTWLAYRCFADPLARIKPAG